MQDNQTTGESRPLLSTRTADIFVALVLLAGCAIVIYDSVGFTIKWLEGGPNRWIPEVSIDKGRFGWQEGFGPGPGYFPFWVAVILGVASLVNLLGALRGRGRGEIFVTLRPFGRVLAVLVPSIIFVALIGGLSMGPVEVPGLGIYVASCLFIVVFMVLVGRENLLKALALGVAVPFALFLMFEKWFLVPLPKGPLEAWLGY
jgi:hypothetical protein